MTDEPKARKATTKSGAKGAPKDKAPAAKKSAAKPAGKPAAKAAPETAAAAPGTDATAPVEAISRRDVDRILHGRHDDPFSVLLPLDPKQRGLRRGTFIGNTGSYPVVEASAADRLARELDVGAVELWPLAIQDHKGRELSREYVCFNPLGAGDWLHDEAALWHLPDGSVGMVERVVLDARKIASAPDVFRLREDPTLMVFSPRARQFVAANGVTNFVFADVDVRGSAS